MQAVTTHRFGIGDAEFRLLPKPGLADTVPYGFFKRNVFEKVGLFDERLVRNQDYELNRRILANGGRIWLDPRIVVQYYNQDLTMLTCGFWRLTRELCGMGLQESLPWESSLAQRYLHLLPG